VTNAVLIAAGNHAQLVVMSGFLIMAAALASVSTPDATCAAKPMDKPSIVSAQGTRLAYVRCGRGAPTIVFEGGFGGDLKNWDRMFPMVGRFAPVFAYSRPGFRGSDIAWKADSDGMRTSSEAAHLLHDALAAAHVRPPYVLVGHSLGGLYIQKFAQLYRKDTAGLVLMDNRPATLMTKCAAEGLSECAGRGNDISPDWSPALKTTFRGITPSEAVAPTPSQLGKLPILVITASKPEEGTSQPFFEAFRAAQRDYARQLNNGRQVTIENSTHSSLSHERAQPVVAEIRRFWESLPNR
jgi:Alpha/beta hydrolase family